MRLLRRNAAELSRNRRLLQAILDHSPEAIVIKDLEGRYVLVNKAFEALSGVTAEAALHRTAKDLFPRVIAEDLAAKERSCARRARRCTTRRRTRSKGASSC